MQDRVRIARRAVAAAAAILLVGVVQGFGANPAAADAAADVAVASVTAGIGSGTAVQQISVPGGSALAGQTDALVIMPDPGVAANGFGASVDAGSEAGASCSADSGDAGFTCAAPDGGWIGGGYLDFDFDAGNGSAVVPACGAACAFTTAVYEDSAGGNPATGTVTAAAETGLGLTVSATTGGSLTMTVTNSGPTETADLSARITGQGGYTITSASSQCGGGSGQGYVCDAGNTSGAQDTSHTWTVQFSGSTGPITVTIAASAAVYPGGTQEMLNGSAHTPVTWTPIAAVAPTPTGSGPAGQPSAPGVTSPVTVKVSVTASATPKTTTKPSAPVKPKPKSSVSATATAKASGTAGLPLAGAAGSTTAPGGVVAAQGDSAQATGAGGSGSNEFAVILIGVAVLVLAALGVWFWRGRLRRGSGEPKPPVTPMMEASAGATDATDGGWQGPAAGAVSAAEPLAQVGPRQPLPTRKRSAPAGSAAAEGAAEALEPAVAPVSNFEPRNVRQAVPTQAGEVAAETVAAETVAAQTVAETRAVPPTTNAAPEQEQEQGPEQGPEPEPRADPGNSESSEDRGNGESTEAAKPGYEFDPMNDTGPIRLDEFFKRPPQSGQ